MSSVTGEEPATAPEPGGQLRADLPQPDPFDSNRDVGAADPGPHQLGAPLVSEVVDRFSPAWMVEGHQAPAADVVRGDEQPRHLSIVDHEQPTDPVGEVRPQVGLEEDVRPVRDRRLAGQIDAQG